MTPCPKKSYFILTTKVNILLAIFGTHIECSIQLPTNRGISYSPMFTFDSFFSERYLTPENTHTSSPDQVLQV